MMAPRLGGLLLVALVTSCGAPEGTSGPEAASQGEKAALADAEAMLDERETMPEDAPSTAPSEDTGS